MKNDALILNCTEDAEESHLDLPGSQPYPYVLSNHGNQPGYETQPRIHHQFRS